MKTYENIKAVLCALLIVTLGLICLDRWANNIVTKQYYTLAPEFCNIKLHGISTLKQAFQDKNTLVFLGSSELVQDVPFKSFEIIKNNQTFKLFPIGKAGTTSLAHTQKLGSVDGVLQNKKVVISLSPSFFLNQDVNREYLIGNSSVLQIKNLLLNNLDVSIKKRFAERILCYPEIFEKDDVLEWMLELINGDHVYLFSLLKPYFLFNIFVCNSQDRVETALEIINTKQINLPTLDFTVQWQTLLKHAEKLSVRSTKTVNNKKRNKKEFLESTHNSKEWYDFELLLAVLQLNHINPLILSMPIHNDILTSQGIDKETYNEYEKQLKQITSKYNFNAIYFKEFEEDTTFFIDNNDHLSAKGWLYYNQAICNYFY